MVILENGIFKQICKDPLVLKSTLKTLTPFGSLWSSSGVCSTLSAADMRPCSQMFPPATAAEAGRHLAVQPDACI